MKKLPLRIQHQGSSLALLSSGECIVEADDRQMPLYFSLPGETVAFEEAIYKRNRFYFLKEVVVPSKERITPVCMHFQHCGGCVLQHMSTELYKAFKKDLVIKPLLAKGIDPLYVMDPIILEPRMRRRANLDVIKKGGEVHCGFHQIKSYRIINLYECHTLTPEIFALIGSIRGVFNEILEDFGKAKIFFTHLPEGVDCSIEVQGVKSIDERWHGILYKFAAENGLLRLIFRHGKKKTHVYGKPVLYVNFDGVPVEVDAYSFLQASNESERILIDFVHGNIPNDAGKIVDLFSGRGTFSIPASRHAAVSAYDSEVNAINALQTAAKTAGLDIAAHVQDLFTSPLEAAILNQFDLVIMDPPRSGCARQIAEVARSVVRTIIYVSCNPETFANDAKMLIDAGYTMHKVITIDQFLWSAHIELAAIFYKTKH